MKKIALRRIVLYIVVWLVASKANAQCYIRYNPGENTFSLKNQLMERILKIDLEKHAFYTSSFTNLQTGVNNILEGSPEFGFKVNGIAVGGGISYGVVDYQMYQVSENVNGSKSLSVLLKGQTASPAEGLLIWLYYEIYPDVPVIRKWLSIENKSANEIIITNLEWESINYEIAPPFWIPNLCTFADVYAQYGQSVHKPPYIGRTDDAALLVYDYEQRHGLLVGNESPAIMKRTSVYADSARISIGMGFENEDFPFKKYLKPDESFTSPKGFVIPVKHEIWQDAFENELAKFVRKYMGVKLFERQNPPMFFYNTWYPFRFNINSQIITETAEAAAKAGVDYYIIDDGWNRNYGDWEVDTVKFPEGLKPVCDYIISKGMKPGLWISLAHVHKESRICKEHPEWLIRDKNGDPGNLHASVPSDCYTMCMESPYFDYIKKKIAFYVKSCNLGYVKLDLASVYSAYKLNHYEAGCYAKNHHHHDKDESLYQLYLKVNQLFDELHKLFPDLYIDCTFEQYGEIYGIDYNLIQHADGDWLSNIEQEPPYGALYMRQLNYERGRIIPASTMLIGNLKINSENSELSFQSLMSATSMMLGDPRLMSDEKIASFKKWSDWIKEMQDKYNFMQFYQTSDVFTRPEISGWDGCARINSEKGGLLFFYRNNSPESERVFPIVWIDENSTYRIYSSLTKELIGEFSGKNLRDEGLKVNIPERNRAEILEIEKSSKQNNQ